MQVHSEPHYRLAVVAKNGAQRSSLPESRWSELGFKKIVHRDWSELFRSILSVPSKLEKIKIIFKSSEDSNKRCLQRAQLVT